MKNVFTNLELPTFWKKAQVESKLRKEKEAVHEVILKNKTYKIIISYFSSSPPYVISQILLLINEYKNEKGREEKNDSYKWKKSLEILTFQPL